MLKAQPAFQSIYSKSGKRSAEPRDTGEISRIMDSYYARIGSLTASPASEAPPSAEQPGQEDADVFDTSRRRVQQANSSVHGLVSELRELAGYQEELADLRKSISVMDVDLWNSPSTVKL